MFSSPKKYLRLVTNVDVSCFFSQVNVYCIYRSYILVELLSMRAGEVPVSVSPQPIRSPQLQSNLQICLRSRKVRCSFMEGFVGHISLTVGAY